MVGLACGLHVVVGMVDPERYIVSLSAPERSALIAAMEHVPGPLAERVRAKLMAARFLDRGARSKAWVSRGRAWLVKRLLESPCKSCGSTKQPLDRYGHCIPTCPLPEALRRSG